VNVAVPFIFAHLVLVFGQGVTSPPWLYLFGYVGLHFLQGSGGLDALLDVSRACSVFPTSLCTSETSYTQVLWTPVMQYSDRGA
jgi:hypothetical protein